MDAGAIRLTKPWRGARLRAPSLRAQRSNPESFRGGILDCFVARAPRNDQVRDCPLVNKAASAVGRRPGRPAGPRSRWPRPRTPGSGPHRSIP
ncbi:hypothetical protein C7G41_24710 [Bradyrhizobium sp. MOS002]|nr:hypothetical protein C7G41_24710 [Bradyrhizobium sp. MOS002]